MCSILGAFDLRPGADFGPLRPLAMSLSARQRHRGPDWSGVHAEPHALLVHERLAIVDPAGGAQPLHSEDGDLTLAVNGEIYNHRALEGARVALRKGPHQGVVVIGVIGRHGKGECPSFRLVRSGRANGVMRLCADALKCRRNGLIIAS